MATVGSRGSDAAVASCLGLARATARALDPQARIRCAASSETAAIHLDVLTSSRNNTWAIRRGLNGADYALLEELAGLVTARMFATRPGRKRPRRTPGHLAGLVILVGTDKIYTGDVRLLKLMGIPTWLIVPGRARVAASLYRAATAVSFVGPASALEVA
jgi:hypothetical protein